MSDEEDAARDKMDELFESIDNRDDDPFDGIDTADRDDPFEELAEAAYSPGESQRDRIEATDRFDELGEDRAVNSDESTGASPPDAIDDSSGTAAGAGDATDDPFEHIAPDHRGGDPFDTLSERPGDDSSESDDLWELLSRGQIEPETERRGQRRYAEVSKHSYCERCEYFSTPPTVSCSHEGTDIIEFVDSETVRVADCPIVAEREALADIDSER